MLDVINRANTCADTENQKDKSITKDGNHMKRTSSCQEREFQEPTADTLNQQNLSKSAFYEEAQSNNNKSIGKIQPQSEPQRKYPEENVISQNTFMSLLRRCGSASQERVKTAKSGKKTRVVQQDNVVRSCNTSALDKRNNQIASFLPVDSSNIFYASSLMPQKVTFDQGIK